MEYIDLGLPSGTLWAAENEEGYYTFDEAVVKFGGSLPTREDFEELLKHCWKRWDDEQKGLELMGNNGAKLFLPASGYRNGSVVSNVQYGGCYWSATYSPQNYAYYFDFDSHETNMYGSDHYFGFTIRLIKKIVTNIYL